MDIHAELSALTGCSSPDGHAELDQVRLAYARQADGAATPEQLLTMLKAHGGPLEALADAGLLFAKKGEDYNTGFPRDQYFPLGLASYAQMLWVKCLRLMSFAKQPRQSNFEGPRDTCLDLISYSAFCADWMQREKAKEKSNG